MAVDDPAATAEGDFRRTPLPHLLVYMADRRLSGALVLREPGGTEHVVRFEWGAPVRVRPGDGYALFGEMLVEAGIVREEVVQNALATKGLLGDVLILTGHAEADELESVASEQLLRRMVRLFALPPETSYCYFQNDDVLAGAAPGCRVDILRLLFEGLRSHPRAGLSLSKLLERVGETPLRMHPDALLERFGFDDAEAAVIQAIVSDRPTLVDLLSSGIAEAGVIRNVVYTLLITRQLDVGQRTLPLGHEETPPPIALGRVALASAVHRIGAAAPDPAGDGERAAVQPRLRRRKTRPEPIPNVPIVGGDGEDEPVSDVIEICPPATGEHAAITGEHAATTGDHASTTGEQAATPHAAKTGEQAATPHAAKTGEHAETAHGSTTGEHAATTGEHAATAHAATTDERAATPHAATSDEHAATSAEHAVSSGETMASHGEHASIAEAIASIAATSTGGDAPSTGGTAASTGEAASTDEAAIRDEIDELLSGLDPIGEDVPDARGPVGGSLPPAVSGVRERRPPNSRRRTTPLVLEGLDEEIEREPISDVQETNGPISVRKRNVGP